MAIQRLRYRLLVGLAITVSIGLVITALFYVRQAENAIIADHNRSLHKITDAVGTSLESIMLGGHAEVAAEFVKRLASVSGARRFTILRNDGRPAFQDNITINEVNRRLGDVSFQPRTNAPELVNPIAEARSAAFLAAVGGKEASSFVRREASGEHVSVFFDPIFGQASCQRCHDGGEDVRGVVLLESSLSVVEDDMAGARFRGLVGLAIALAGTMAVTGYLLGRMLFDPIEGVTRAMGRVSTGDWEHGVPVESGDEIGQMAGNFNVMREQLRDTYMGMVAEQDKLTTILLAAREAVVVTDASGRIVLVNPAAEEILGKSLAEVEADGFEQIVDDPVLIRNMLGGDVESTGLPVRYRDKIVEVSASTITDADGVVIGSAALIRDIDEETRLRERLERLARTDELTGLYNRRHLDERFAQELARAQDAGTPLAVMIYDVDHFKRFNDEHGHEAGDRVLRAVGRETRETLRRYDALGRYGGEEFVAVLPGVHGPDGGAVAERLRSDIEAMDVDGLKVTISIGVACTGVVADATPESLLTTADAALYRAKDAGRNRVEVASVTAQPAEEIT